MEGMAKGAGADGAALVARENPPGGGLVGVVDGGPNGDDRGFTGSVSAAAFVKRGLMDAGFGGRCPKGSFGEAGRGLMTAGVDATNGRGDAELSTPDTGSPARGELRKGRAAGGRPSPIELAVGAGAAVSGTVGLGASIVV